MAELHAFNRDSRSGGFIGGKGDLRGWGKGGIFGYRLIFLVFIARVGLGGCCSMV